MATIISENPFLKNDQNRLGKIKSLVPSFGVSKEKEASDVRNKEKGEEDEIVDERKRSVHREELKQELVLVLKGIREKEKGRDGSGGGEDVVDDYVTDKMKYKEVNTEHQYLRSTSTYTTVLYLYCEDVEDNQEDISDKAV